MNEQALSTGMSLMFPIGDTGGVGEIRRGAVAMAKDIHFDETQSGRIGIIVTELASNLAKHATSGELIIRHIRHRGVNGMEILSVDKGPGIADIGKCMEDGYSTAGSPGTGLGATVRLSDVFDIYSQENKGTVIVSQSWAKKLPATEMSHVQIGAICLPMHGEKACGDGWALHHGSEGLHLLVSDGLGHGIIAAQATIAAIAHFNETPERTPREMMHSVHQALRSTRGTALAAVAIKPEEAMLTFAGVGNIAGTILDGTKPRGLASYNGIVGHQVHKIQEIQYPWPEDAVLVMHSDGLSNRWKLEDYPGLRQRHCSLIAAILYRDYQRGRDDVTVLVVRHQ